MNPSQIAPFTILVTSIFVLFAIVNIWSLIHPPPPYPPCLCPVWPSPVSSAERGALTVPRPALPTDTTTRHNHHPPPACCNPTLLPTTADIHHPGVILVPSAVDPSVLEPSPLPPLQPVSPLQPLPHPHSLEPSSPEFLEPDTTTTMATIEKQPLSDGLAASLSMRLLMQGKVSSLSLSLPLFLLSFLTVVMLLENLYQSQRWVKRRLFCNSKGYIRNTEDA